MVDAVKKDDIPEQVAHGHGLAGEERERSIEIFDLQFAHARHRVAMKALEAGRKLLDFARSLDSRRPAIARELSELDRVRGVRIALSEMPGELAERAASSIRAEFVLIARQCREQFHGLRRFAVPALDEAVHFVHGHGLSSFA